jgi:hypothetical protein
MTFKTKNRKWSKEYTAWANMVRRCTSESISYKRNRRGTIYENIEIEPSWLGPDGFQAFMDEIGPSPEGMVLDRENNSKGYIKGNIKWSTVSDSNKNKSNGRLITAFGKTQNLIDWERETGLKSNTIKNRIDNLHWPVEKALTYRPYGYYNDGRDDEDPA